MTKQQAIDVLRHYVTNSEHDTANNIAIYCIEKQIPKKPYGTHYAHMKCPACDHRVPSGMGSSSRRRDNWCNYCGQALDWEG